MINRLSNPINRNRSAAKISKVMSSIAEIGGHYMVVGHFWGHEDGSDYLDVDDNLVDGERG